MRQKLLLLAAVFFGVLAFMFTYHQINLEKQKIQGSAIDFWAIQVIKDMAEGDKLTDDNIRLIKTRRFANSPALSREIPGNKKDMVIDRQVQVPLAAGHTLEWTDLKSSIASGRSGLSALVRPGFRAISIAVDSTASVTGLIQPNNQVDLIGTFKFPDMKGDSALDTITLTILQNVRIIATGTDIGMQDRNANRNAPKSYGTVTLELTPKEVEMIIFASQKGRIQLSLRNFEETSVNRDLQSVNWKYLQDNIQNYTKERELFIRQRSHGVKASP